MLELKHIRKSFDGVTILEDINLTIGDGEIVSILGPSGCGKTTLLNLILGITDADSGRCCSRDRTSPGFPWRRGDLTLYSRIMRCSPTSMYIRTLHTGLRTAGDFHEPGGGGIH